jgi:hypothetical protein
MEPKKIKIYFFLSGLRLVREEPGALWLHLFPPPCMQAACRPVIKKNNLIFLTGYGEIPCLLHACKHADLVGAGVKIYLKGTKLKPVKRIR